MRHVLLLILAMLFLVGCTTTSTSFTTPYSTSTPTEAAGDVDLQKAAKARLTLGLSYLENGEFQLAKSNLDKALGHLSLIHI